MGGSLYFWYTLQNYGEVSGVAISALDSGSPEPSCFESWSGSLRCVFKQESDLLYPGPGWSKPD